MADPPIPPMPGPQAQKDFSPEPLQIIGDNDNPIRLSPKAEKMRVSSQKTSHDNWQAASPSTDETWTVNLTETPKGFSRHLVPAIIGLALCLMGALYWGLTHKEKANSPTKLANPPHSTTHLNSPLKGQGQTWESEAQQVLHNYLIATAKINKNSEERLLYVTPSLETQTLLPNYLTPQDTSDVVDASGFVAKTLPDSFLKHGIYLMYYQRPNTPSDDTLFRPIAPMRVNLKLDSPSFLDNSAYSSHIHDQNQQNIYAFFKRNDDGQLTLDWPIFAQTRHRQLARFVQRQHVTTRKTFRLMVLKLEATLKENIYNQQNPDRDWYRVHCPGYDQETHIVSVPSRSPAANFLNQVFSTSPNHHQQMHAITAELAWLPKRGNQRPTLEISKIICLEFLGLTAELKTR